MRHPIIYVFQNRVVAKYHLPMRGHKIGLPHMPNGILQQPSLNFSISLI
jgi:hypothetical protein